jgi:Glucodextranase, domain B/PASTA domain
MRPVVLLACLAAAAAGCGGDDGQRAQRVPPPVVVGVSAPADMAVVRTETVDVRGTVSPPGAGVRVLGQAADVVGGTFYATVSLEPGANVIDVMATARGRSPAMTALRVTREMLVEVPDLQGLEVPEVEQRLGELGLKADVTVRRGLFDEVLPGERAVCDQDPEAGDDARRGSTVRVEISRGC